MASIDQMPTKTAIQPGASDTHPLVRRVTSVARIARVLLVVRALLISVTALAACLLLLGLTDWTVRSDGAFYRWTMSGGVAIGLIACCYCLVAPAFCSIIDSVQVAKRIEGHFPRLGDQLSSSIAFLRRSTKDPLQLATIANTQDRCQGLSFANVIEPKATLQCGSVAFIACITLAGFGVRYPSASSIVSARLMQPWRSVEWPRQNALEIVSLPTVLRQGATLEVVVRDSKGVLPDDTLVQVENSDSTRSLPPRQRGDGGIVSIDNVQSDLRVRAIGGDDQAMAWHSVRVTPMPEVASHLWVLNPPAYTNREPRNIEAQNFETLRGTRCELQIQLSAAVDRAELMNLGTGKTFTGEASPESDSFTFREIEFLESAELELSAVSSGAEKLEAALERWKIDVSPDQTPNVQWYELPAFRLLTTEAAFSIQWRADDDLGIAQHGLSIEHGDANELTLTTKEPPEAKDSKSEIGVFELLLSEMDLKLNSELTVFAWAKDSLRQRGESERITYRIVSKEQIRDELADVEQQLLDKVRDSAAEQRHGRELTESAAGQIERNPNAIETAIPTVRKAIDRQNESLHNLSDSIASAAGAAQMLATNNIDPVDRSRLDDAVGRLQDLALKMSEEAIAPLTSIAELHTEATSDSILGQLQRAESSQGEISEQLDAIASTLQSRETLRDLARRFEELSEEQIRLQQDLSTADSSQRLNDLARRQLELSRRSSEILDDLKEQAATAEGHVDSESSRADRAAQRLQDSDVIGEMRRAANEIGDQQIGKASGRQERILNEIEGAQDALAGRDRSQAEATAEAVAEASKQLDQVVDAQHEITQQLSEGETELDHQLSEIQQQTVRLREQLNELGASEAADRLDDAEANQQRGRSELADGNASRAADASRDSEADLAVAMKELERLEEQLAEQQRQEELWDTIELLERAGQEQRALAEQLAQSVNEDELKDVARQALDHQRRILDRLDGADGKFTEALGIGLVIESARRDMQLVAAELERNQLTPITISSAEAAADKLEQVVQALMDLARSSQRNQESTDEAQNDEQEPMDEENDHENLQAGLKLLVSYQEWLLAETKELETGRDNAAIAEQELQRRTVNLARQQQQVLDEFQKIKQEFIRAGVRE